MIRRFAVVLSVVALLLATMVPVTSAAAASQDKDTTSKSSPSEKVKHKKTYVEYTGEKALEMARRCGVAIPSNGKLVKFVLDESVVDTTDSGASAIALFGYYVSNVQWSSACGAPVIAAAAGVGPGHLTLSQTTGVTATWSSNTSITAEAVSAGLGFEVGKEYSVTVSYEVDVPAGELWEIQAHALYSVANFEVWYDPLIGYDYWVGNGIAYKPIGACYAVVSY